MDLSELPYCGIFGSYFALIFFSFLFVFRSVFKGVPIGDGFTGRPFLFLRTGFCGLLCTWYYMIKFMLWSFQDYSSKHAGATFGSWLKNTGLFEQAWSIACNGQENWWWSSWICTWTVIFAAIVWRESARRQIPHPWAYLLLGMLVAISVSTSLFLSALYLHPRRTKIPEGGNWRLYAPLLIAYVEIYQIPLHANDSLFLTYLLLLHFVLFIPFQAPVPPVDALHPPERSEYVFLQNFREYIFLLLPALFLHERFTQSLLAALPKGADWKATLWKTVWTHPAQSSISLDVIWVGITLFLWLLVSGRPGWIAAKLAIVVVVAGVAWARYTGVNWGLMISVVPIAVLAGVGGLAMWIGRIRSANAEKRRAILDSMGIVEGGVVPGEKGRPPRKREERVVVGFWHPYCNAGGGGERVLWSAIAYLQRTQPLVVSLVYSGDFPEASKEAILGRVQDRFGISLSAGTISFVPLKKRYLIGDKFWPAFTLLGQSLGSVMLAWEGLCGRDGMWGDIFIDTMGYAFTLPFTRWITGGEVITGAYIHYPTVSADMVKRVKERRGGVEDGGASKSGWRTRVKLVYYHIFTSLYSTSLLFSSYPMTNSSWTQAHIQSLLLKGRSSFLASLLLLDDKSRDKKRARGEEVTEMGKCEVVYPPCDTSSLVGLKLDGRGREGVSLAQFRPEKDHAKQLHALAHLFKQHPECRNGKEQVRLTMMGGVRDEGDQARLDGLKGLANELGVANNVEFVSNAPYPDIIRRLGQASLGLNTMQDEHFGINVVEFMAAGLIPVVHASAGPLMDIVVPYQREKTGFHATTAEEFGDAIYEALSLPVKVQEKMRKAARGLAVEKFSQEAFERGFEKGWRALLALAEERRRLRID